VLKPSTISSSESTIVSKQTFAGPSAKLDCMSTLADLVSQKTWIGSSTTVEAEAPARNVFMARVAGQPQQWAGAQQTWQTALFLKFSVFQNPTQNITFLSLGSLAVGQGAVLSPLKPLAVTFQSQAVVLMLCILLEMVCVEIYPID
jgi:hypothetical protein